jgi:hypothetical protein
MITEKAVINVIVSSYKGILLNSKIGEIVENVKMLISNVYKDIGQAHFDAAKDALSSARDVSRTQKKVEINSAINHLRDAYFINYQLIEMKRSEKISFFGLFSENIEKPVIAFEHKVLLFKSLTDIATLLSLCYRDIGETNSFKMWKERASDNFDKYLDLYSIDISMNDLSKINSNFVRTVTSSSAGAVKFGGAVGESYLTTTDIGEKYLTEQNEKTKHAMKKEFIDSFKKAAI